jgi:hypothetical protein
MDSSVGVRATTTTIVVVTAVKSLAVDEDAFPLTERYKPSCDQTGNQPWAKQGTDDTLQTEQATDCGPLSFDLLVKFPTHVDALREIERLRSVAEYAEHHEGCIYPFMMGDACTCGLSMLEYPRG